MRGRLLLLAALLLAPTAAALGEGPAGPAWPIRVLVRQGGGRLSVSGSSALTFADPTTGLLLGHYRAYAPVTVSALRGGVGVDGRAFAASAVLVEPVGGGWVRLEGRPYRGVLRLSRDGGGRLMAVNVLPLEEYVRGVMRAEIAPDWPLEAMRAQAVVARTYALHAALTAGEAPYDVTATTADQVYAGAWGEDSRTDEAVLSTRGVVLTYEEMVIPAFYHSASGGMTEDAVEVWEKRYPFIVGVSDPFSAGAPHHLWEETLPEDILRRRLTAGGYPVGAIVSIEPATWTRSGRVRYLTIRHGAGALTLEAKVFRQLVGAEVLRSTHFTVLRNGNHFTFVGRGWGHGVGLSQWGAKGMADLAFGYEEILRYYFPLGTLLRLPGS
ncbi:MAG: SpoIID/LytB domain-containing protein [candidate division NC10 bacterium]|nr:SpoIID/LytB domain-containing protein [candidate division NC10 bacterium]